MGVGPLTPEEKNLVDPKLRYSCTRMLTDYAEPVCQSLLGNPLNDLISHHLLEAIKPSALEVSLQVAADIEKERSGLVTHWEKQLERSHYEVERAYRQYNAVEPENRLVVRNLEKNWEEALACEEKLKREYARFLEEQPAILTEAERKAIQQLASDVPGLWSASTTTSKERQEIVRLLIERVIVLVEGNTEKVYVEIHWWGGHKTNTHLVRPVAKLEQLSYYSQLLERVKTLSEENMGLVDIAKALNQEGFRPAKRREQFNASMVSSLLIRAGVKSNKTIKSEQVARQANEWTFREISQKLNIPEPTLYSWMRKGQLRVRRDKETRNGIWLIYADEKEIKRLQDIRNRPKQWIYNSKVQKVH